MIKKELKDIFQNKLKEHESSFDLDQGWNELEPHLNNKKRRRLFIFVFLFGSASAVIALLFFLSNRISTDQLSAPLITSQSEVTSENEQSMSSNNNTLLTDNQITPSNDLVSQSTIPASVDVKKTNETESLRRGSFNLKKGSNEQNSDNIDKVAQSKQSIAIKKDDPFGSKFYKERRSSNQTSAELLNINSEPKSELDQLSKIPIIFSDVIPDNKPGIDHLLPNGEILKISNEPTKFKPGLSVSIESGIGLFENNFEYTDLEPSGLNPETYIEELESINIGGKFHYNFKNKLSLNLGIEYSRINEHFAYNGIKAVSRQVEGVQSIIYNPAQGDSTYISGTLTQEGQEYREIGNYNKYENWNIPIGLSYHTSNKRLSFNPEVGAILNIASAKSGKELDKSEVVNLSQTRLYKKSVGVMVYLRPQIEFSFNNSLSILLSPEVRKSMNNWSRQEGVTVKPIFYNLFLGLKKNF